MMKNLFLTACVVFGICGVTHAQDAATVDDMKPQIEVAEKTRAAGHTDLIGKEMAKKANKKIKIIKMTPESYDRLEKEKETEWWCERVFIVSPQYGGESYMLADYVEGCRLTPTTIALSGRKTRVVIEQFNEVLHADKDLDMAVDKIKGIMLDRAVEQLRKNNKGVQIQSIEQAPKLARPVEEAK